MEELLKTLNDKIGKLDIQRNKAIASFFKTLLLDYPSIYELSIKGWTPFFNDGDECVHEQNCEINGFGEYWDYDSTEEEFENSGTNEDEFNNLRKVISSAIIEDTLYSILNTNWEIHITKNKKFVCVVKDYKCSY